MIVSEVKSNYISVGVISNIYFFKITFNSPIPSTVCMAAIELNFDCPLKYRIYLKFCNKLLKYHILY